MLHYAYLCYLMVPYITFWYLMLSYGTLRYFILPYGTVCYLTLPDPLLTYNDLRVAVQLHDPKRRHIMPLHIKAKQSLYRPGQALSVPSG
jgi:hypothetical protein